MSFKSLNKNDYADMGLYGGSPYADVGSGFTGEVFNIDPSNVMEGFSIGDIAGNTSDDSIFSLNNIFGGADSQGWLGSTLGGIGSILGGYGALKQYGLAKDALDFQKDAYALDTHNKAQLLKDELAYRDKLRAIHGGATGEQALAQSQQSADERNIQGAMYG